MLVEMMQNGSKNMSIVLDDEMCNKFERYHEMLVSAGKVMNLTRVPDDPLEAVDRNYLDSLTPLAVPGLMQGARTLVDVGSGAGFPGIPLAIALPQLRVTMVDALSKRVGFLQSVIDALGLLNATAVHARLEDAARMPMLRGQFDLATARAVADTAVLCEWALPFLRVGGQLIAYKGPAIDEELPRAAQALATLGGEVQRVVSAPLPGRDWDHRLLIVQKIAPTSKRFPRKPGEPARNPL
ncbi:MAG: 16S rRNA (guanine(527)-N(7))-methyltransferase RsmG [Clostridia bacterium]